ncbi:aminotransferase [Elioraea sp.]|uniref:aminotransferase n=1 Tax=Elioraea sp. TaxID=2185103 RepID=UPI003F72E57D
MPDTAAGITPLSLPPSILATAAPAIPTARGWAAVYRGEAGPAIDLTQAVPGYPPHPNLLARLGEEAARTANAGYGPIEGEEPLRAALAADLSRRYRDPLDAADVVITAGCNLAFVMTMMAIAGPGSAVLLPAPWYFNHHMALTMLGITTIPLPCRPEDGFVPDPERAAALMDGRVRALVLVTPNNPTGAVYPAETIAAFAALGRRRGIVLVLDETYRDFLPGNDPPHALFGDPAWRDGLVHLYSFSKSYCVPGHRVGAVVAGPAIRTQLLKVLDTLQICAPRASQAALAWAVPALIAWREGNRDVMAARAAAFQRALAAVPGWRIDALGGYFAYLRLPEGAPDALTMAERLGAEHGLMTLPGPFFGPGQERHLRVAFANADEATIAQVPARLG